MQMCMGNSMAKSNFPGAGCSLVVQHEQGLGCLLAVGGGLTYVEGHMFKRSWGSRKRALVA